MPRIRTIKPEFWQDFNLSRMEVAPRLVFLCLISMADDEGRIEGDSETVKAFGFPRERSRMIDEALTSLRDAGRIILYEAGNPYIAIPHFQKHQKIDRPSKSKLPDPPVAVEPTFDEASRGLDEDSPTYQVSGIKDQGSRIKDQVSATRGGGYPEAFEEWWSRYPKKVGKGAALKAWKSGVGVLERVDALSAIEGHAQAWATWPADRKQFIPNPATWLNQRRWEDDVPEKHSEATPRATDRPTTGKGVQDQLGRVMERIRAEKAQEAGRLTDGV